MGFRFSLRFARRAESAFELVGLRSLRELGPPYENWQSSGDGWVRGCSRQRFPPVTIFSQTVTEHLCFVTA